MADRRLSAGVLVALAVAVGLALWGGDRRADPPATREVEVPHGPSAPVARLRRGAAPVVTRAPVVEPTPGSPAPGADPAPAAAPGAGAQDTRTVARTVTLEDLDPAARARLSEVALAHLADLVEGCEGLVDAREDLGAFLMVDAAGVAALDVRPIAREAGPIRVEDRPLAPELVECLDDRVWDQDWSGAGAALPPGAELPLALTMRLRESG